MNQLKSKIMYGFSIVSTNGELDYDTANDISLLIFKTYGDQGVKSIWAGKERQNLVELVVGIELEEYDEYDNTIVNLKDLFEKEKEAKENLPAQEILKSIQFYLIRNNDDENSIQCTQEPETHIVHYED